MVTTYINDNISKAKTDAESKNYSEAITFLDTVLKFDSTCKEASSLKEQYNNEIQKIKDEEAAAKKKAEEAAAAVKKAEEEAAQAAANTKQSASNSTSTTATTDLMKVNNGCFVYYKNSQDTTMPTDIFGLRTIDFAPQPNGIYYQFVGNDVDYEITLYLPNGTIKKSGKSSDEMMLISAQPQDVPKGKSIQIDISIVYKGKTYKDSFSKVINNLG